MIRKIFPTLLLAWGHVCLLWATGCGSPCDGVDCGDHGECDVIDGSAVCVCEEGYHAEDTAGTGTVHDRDLARPR